MTSQHSKFFATAILATVVSMGATAGLVSAADTTPATTPPGNLTPADTASAKLLSLAEIETRLASQGIRIKEIEVKDKLLEVEAYDAQGREIELLVDRRTAEILSRKLED